MYTKGSGYESRFGRIAANQLVWDRLPASSVSFAADLRVLNATHLIFSQVPVGMRALEEVDVRVFYWPAAFDPEHDLFCLISESSAQHLCGINENGGFINCLPEHLPALEVVYPLYIWLKMVLRT